MDWIGSISSIYLVAIWILKFDCKTNPNNRKTQPEVHFTELVELNEVITFTDYQQEKKKKKKKARERKWTETQWLPCSLIFLHPKLSRNIRKIQQKHHNLSRKKPQSIISIGKSKQHHEPTRKLPKNSLDTHLRVDKAGM